MTMENREFLELLKEKKERLIKSGSLYGLIKVLADDCLGGDVGEAKLVIDKLLEGLNDGKEACGGDRRVYADLLVKLDGKTEDKAQLDAIVKGMKALVEKCDALEMTNEEIEEGLGKCESLEEKLEWAKEEFNNLVSKRAEYATKNVWVSDVKEKDAEAGEYDEIYTVAALYALVKNGDIEMTEDADAYAIGVSGGILWEARALSEKMVAAQLRKDEFSCTLAKIAAAALVVGTAVAGAVMVVVGIVIMWESAPMVSGLLATFLVCCGYLAVTERDSNAEWLGFGTEEPAEVDDFLVEESTIQMYEEKIDEINEVLEIAKEKDDEDEEEETRKTVVKA